MLPSRAQTDISSAAAFGHGKVLGRVVDDVRVRATRVRVNAIAGVRAAMQVGAMIAPVPTPVPVPTLIVVPTPVPVPTLVIGEA